MLKNVAGVSSEGKSTGLNTQDNILAIDKSQSPNMVNVKVHFDGSLEKRLGSNTQNAVIILNSGASGFMGNSAGALTTGLIAYWKLDEPSGTRFDSFGSNHLGDGNGVGQTGGIKNQAALFVAANSQFLLKENTSTLATGDINFSISSWFYINTTSNTVERTIVAKRDNSFQSDVKLLLHCDGSDGSTTFLDSSLDNRTVTANNGAEIDTDQFKFGTASGFFIGSSARHLSIPTSTDFDFLTGDFTIDFWVRFNTISGFQTLIDRGNTTIFGISKAAGGEMNVALESINVMAPPWSPGTASWIHVAVARASTSLRAFIDGNQIGTTVNNSDNVSGTGAVTIADTNTPANGFFGNIDEVRIIKGRAAYTQNFTPPTAPYVDPRNPSQYEYWLYVNTDNIVTFRVSSSGISENGTVQATSFGAIGTATWYNAIAWHDTSDIIGLSVNLHNNSATYVSGVRAGSAPFVLGAISSGTSSFMDGRIDETSFYKKVLSAGERNQIYNVGSSNSFQTAFDSKPWASFDFGASSIRWLTVAAGTGVYASSNLGVTWVNIATDRTANYQYFERSQSVLIATSDSYDTVLAWPGSAGTFMVRMNSNAPLTRYAINFQGFLVLLNSNLRKRGVFYQNDQTQLTGTWASSFDLPSSFDDEITGAFAISRRLYVSTRYYLYRLTYVGGNPDFNFEKVKDWGYVSRTMKFIYLDQVGQVAVGLCWDGKIRLFDGSNDQIISNNVEQDNGICDFSLDNLSFAGSGPVVSFAETENNDNIYKLCIAIGTQSTQTTHFLNYDGRAKSFYPYNRQLFNTMVMAESGNRRFLMAFDRSGYVHMMDSGNLDGNTTPITDIYDSNLIFEKSPSAAQKGHQTNLFFTSETCGRIYYEDRTDFGNDFKLKNSFMISGSDRKFLIHEVVDTPESYNAYQWRISSSSGTSNPWKLQRYDHILKGLGIGKE